ncbi:hypothetical protein [Streptomyces scabiei]|uniref:hypothetical protein n=1 Tax=Streptomyces scabiei TaxID=1930 RepID=UPI0029AF8B9D|nr:hypothetical protein [Streptomyces scabiei]MDX3026735.1 hypothetical protein [Streptomyces scabiei]MDX3208079.1 hypothetical protein [Streptomyces scabiei]
MTSMTVHLDQQFHSIWFGKKRWQVTFRPWAAVESARTGLTTLRQSHSEVLQAYLDLRLVANPEPLQAADHVLERMNAVLDLSLGVRNSELFEVTNRVAEAQREFVDVCRDDLWYLPQRWQFYRKAWWSARRWPWRRHHAPHEQ